jgi:hypothetical protein
MLPFMGTAGLVIRYQERPTNSADVRRHEVAKDGESRR